MHVRHNNGKFLVQFIGGWKVGGQLTSRAGVENKTFITTLTCTVEDLKDVKQFIATKTEEKWVPSTFAITETMKLDIEDARKVLGERNSIRDFTLLNEGGGGEVYYEVHADGVTLTYNHATTRLEIRGTAIYKKIDAEEMEETDGDEDEEENSGEDEDEEEEEKSGEDEDVEMKDVGPPRRRSDSPEF